MFNNKSEVVIVVFCALTAQVASADVIYKCSKGSTLVYQDEPCKPGKYHADVLTSRNAKGTVNYLRGDNAPKSAAVLEAPRVLGKPPIKMQLTAPTAIESGTQAVWSGVKQWFGNLLE
jgi:hypothetical protein